MNHGEVVRLGAVRKTGKRRATATACGEVMNSLSGCTELHCSQT